MEMLVVMGIVALLIAVTVPSFSAIMASQNRTLAFNKLGGAMAAARDLAARSSVGVDSAAVFFYEPGGRTRIVTCIKVGEIADRVYGSNTETQIREVFVPSPLAEPVELPPGWMIRGYAPAGWVAVSGSPGDVWYETTIDAGQRVQRNWLFPESGFYDHDSFGVDGVDRQTFLIRFEGGSGRHMGGASQAVLVVDIRPSLKNRVPFSQTVPMLTDVSDLVRTTKQLLARTDVSQTRIRDEYFGDWSTDTVMSKPVPVIALYKETDLAAGIGERVDRGTGSLYVSPATTRITDPVLPAALQGGGYETINAWFDGVDSSGKPIDREARYFRIDRYSGRLVEMIPEPSGGVAP